MNFIAWHYLVGWKWYWKRVFFNIKKIAHFFSFGILLKSLFAPWKRLTIDDEVGFDIKKFFENLSFNMISATIGAIIRIFLVIFCLLSIFFYLIVSILFFVCWWLFPPFSWSYYANDQKRWENVLKRIIEKIKNEPDKTGLIIVNSEPWKFIEEKMEKNIRDIVLSIKVETLSLKDIKLNSLEELVNWFLSNEEKIEVSFQKLGLKKDDLILAARWWDEKQLFKKEKEINKWSLGRPGIGWGLLFGYTPNLNKYSEDLTLRQQFANHLIGREEVVRRMEKVINSGKNILLVGDPGVGKMTVVYEFAQRAITGDLGKNLSYKKLVLLDYQTAMAGSGDRDFKKKILKDLMREAERAGDIVVVLKDLFRITNADFEGNDYSDIVSSVLERRKISMISLVGRLEYETFLARDQRILKNFEVVEVLPPNKETAMLILMRAVDEVESLQKVRFSIQALKQILEGSDRYITETPFPEKALELMDQVAMSSASGKKLITADEVNLVLSEKTGISVSRLTESEKKKLGKLEEIISQELIGQKMAINWIAKSLRSRVAAIKNEERPVGSFLFLGPTGVGKTQTAKVLADVYFGSKDNILRFDMAEYSGSEALTRLVGSVEKNQPGIMTTSIKNKPASLILLDEIEKASKEIYNLFLTMLDEGYINDSKGNKVVCRHSFVVATSNAGSKFIREQVMNGIEAEDLQKTVIDYVQKQGIFSPEFLNRFDGVVVFEPLNEDNLVSIAKLMLKDLKKSLSDKNINIVFDEGVAEKIAKEGFSLEFGARPMRRIVELVLGDLIGKAIVNDDLKAGDEIKLIAGLEKDAYRLEKI